MFEGRILPKKFALKLQHMLHVYVEQKFTCKPSNYQGPTVCQSDAAQPV